MEDGGFYWVRVPEASEPTVGQWVVTRWFVVGAILPLTAGDVTVVSERLLPPGGPAARANNASE